MKFSFISEFVLRAANSWSHEIMWYETLAAASIIMVWDVIPCSSSVYSVCAEDLKEPADKTTCHLNQEYYNPQEIMFCQIRVLNLLNKAVTLLFFFFFYNFKIKLYWKDTNYTFTKSLNLSRLQVQAIPNFILCSLDGSMSTYCFIRIFSIISKTDGLILKHFPLYD